MINMDRMILLQQEQVEKLPFPPGSKVYTYDDTQCPPCADSHGTVSGAFLLTGAGVTPSVDFLYKVDLSMRGETNSRSELLLGKHLRFQNGTPVHVLKSRGNGDADADADGYGYGNGQLVPDGMKSEIVDGIVLGTCDIPNDDRRKYTSDTFWYSIQILGSEDEGMSEIIHEVLPRDVAYRTVPAFVQIHSPTRVVETVPSVLIQSKETIQDHQDRTTNENEYLSYKNTKGEDVINMVKCETQTTGSSLKRDREGMNTNIQGAENGAVASTPSPPMGGILIPTPTPSSKCSGGGNSEMIDDEPSSKRQRGMIDGDGVVSRLGNGNPTSISPESTKNTSHDDSSEVLPATPVIRQGEDISRELSSPQQDTSERHHEPKSHIQMPTNATNVGKKLPDINSKSKICQLRPPPKRFEFIAIIDIPSPIGVVGGGLIGNNGCTHRELSRISKCFISFGGGIEASQVRIYGDTAEDVALGVREVKDRLFEVLKGQDPHNLQRIMDNTKVEHFRDDTLVSKFVPGPGPSSKKNHLHLSDLPSNRTLRREHSDIVPRGNLLLMLPGIDFVELSRVLFPRLHDLLKETGCSWISPEKDADGTSYVKVYAHVVQVTEDGIHYIFDHLERELGLLPDAFILEKRS